jgi:hypothetical protein
MKPNAEVGLFTKPSKIIDIKILGEEAKGGFS